MERQKVRGTLTEGTERQMGGDRMSRGGEGEVQIQSRPEKRA